MTLLPSVNKMYNCKTCGKDYPSDQMRWSNTNRKNPTTSICKECFNIYQQKYRKNNPEKFKQYREDGRDTIRNWKLKTKYGMTREEFNSKLELQLNGCAICKEKLIEPHVDHDHTTNKVRDLLCTRCNVVLGLLHEDEDLIWDILEYLKRHTGVKYA